MLNSTLRDSLIRRGEQREDSVSMVVRVVVVEEEEDEERE